MCLFGNYALILYLASQLLCIHCRCSSRAHMCLPIFTPALMLPLSKVDYIGPNSCVWGALMEAEAMREITGIKQDLWCKMSQHNSPPLGHPRIYVLR